MTRWTLDTRIDITTTGRQILRAVRERPMLRCSFCKAAIHEADADQTGNEYALCDICAEDAQKAR